jgi:beta-xylosidase
MERVSHDGEFSNPVIPGFHPDPSICRAGAEYYLACSSFEYSPGVPVFRSRDLVHWEQVGNALTRPLPEGTPSSGGVYAPTLRYHDSQFWLITSDVSGGGTLLLTATDPAGPWSDPVKIPGVTGIDPDICWDGAGNCWCTYAGIGQVRIDPRTGETLSSPRELWSGTPGAQWPEAPHLYQIGDYWYLLIAEGGTERGHCVSIARGPAPDGPFEPCPANPVLSHRSTSQPIQSTGHADLVQGPDGSWWMVLLGTRPRGGTPGWHVLGRETFLAPVTWDDGWPVIGPVAPVRPAPGWPLSPVPGSPSATASPAREDFDSAALDPRWISPRSGLFSLTERPGYLSLHARAGSLDDPLATFVGRRQQHLSCRTRALVVPSGSGSGSGSGPGSGPGRGLGGRGGLAIRLDERHHYEVEVTDGEVTALARIGPLRQALGTLARVRPGPVILRIDVEATPPGLGHPGQGPDIVSLGVQDGDDFIVLAQLDGRYLSTEVAGGFTGRVIGLYATAGTVHFDWFGYEADPD